MPLWPTYWTAIFSACQPTILSTVNAAHRSTHESAICNTDWCAQLPAVLSTHRKSLLSTYFASYWATDWTTIIPTDVSAKRSTK